MYYLEVLIGDAKYHGDGALTYCSETEIPAGSIVVVSLRGRRVLGIVTTHVQKPSFAVSPIISSGLTPHRMPAQTLSLLEWLRAYYPAPLGVVTRQFMPPSVSQPKSVANTVKSPKPEDRILPLPPITDEQKYVLAHMPSAGSVILHGATGTGKTRVYIELTKQVMSQKKSAIILTPEIGLTAQLVESFESQFPEQVVVFHSRLTAASRRDLWYKVLGSDKPLIIIGPRSALFLPIADVGLIVIDEVHEAAYKNESSPNYVSSRVAAKLAALHGALFVMGSATPSVEDYFVASKKQRPILQMTTPATSHVSTATKLTLVDMKDHSNFPNSAIISSALENSIASSLQRHEQALLFLNRRGTAKVVLCNTCGWQVLCPRCDLPLTYHGDQHLLRCHVCNHSELLPGTCPTCGNNDILLKSFGTKAVVSEISRLFPSANVKRFDTDIAKDEQLEQNLSALKLGSIDIVVGTQVIAKGLDLPKLSVVGVLNADTSLYIPDYTANERTYQLLSQVIGRVGRGHIGGEAVIQTYSPDNATISAATLGDWPTFYASELEERRTYMFPPFCYMLRLSCGRSTSDKAQQAAQALYDTLKTSHHNVVIEGPAPSFHTKLHGKYNWQLIVKTKHREDLVDIIHGLPSGWTYDIDPSNLL